MHLQPETRTTTSFSTPGGPASEPEPSVGDLRRLLVRHLGTVERLVRMVGHRHALSEDDLAELDGEVKLRLVEDGYAVLRQWKGEAKLTTYLTVVVGHCLQDYRIRRWGRWRSSALAKRLGTEAEILETLLFRDGLTFDEALAMLRSRYESRTPTSELEEMAGRLKPHYPRRFEGEGPLRLLTTSEDVSARVRDRERAMVVDLVEAVVGEALKALEAEERLLLRLKYRDGISLKKIAAVLGLRQRAVYSLHYSALRRLRRFFEGRGLVWSVVREVLGWPKGEVVFPFSQDREQSEDEEAEEADDSRILP